MKRLIGTSALLFACVSGEALAVCTPPFLAGANLTNLVQGNTVCASLGGDRWQEQHRAGGQLWDYKRGPTDPIDPTKQVGSWNTTGNTITHSYIGGSAFSYNVHDNGNGTYSFCGAGVEVVATILPGLTSCP